MTANEALQMLRAYCPSTIQLVLSEGEALEINLKGIVFPDQDGGGVRLKIDTRMVYVDSIRGGRHSATSDCQSIHLSRGVLSAGVFSSDQIGVVTFAPDFTMRFHGYEVRSIIFTPRAKKLQRAFRR